MSLRAESGAIREVGVRQLKSEAAAVLHGVVNGERVIVTRHGHPIAVMLSVEQAGDLLLTSSEEFLRMRLRAHEELGRIS
ncbi:MAG TPA: type II toxin-antitoxin system prevent-host-death family antitoxin [Solirubrobacterales bacterium]|nr:type II toxin-antitoxin system prevent-host-death family antitoxin [Solirubrobacterales bacterium]